MHIRGLEEILRSNDASGGGSYRPRTSRGRKRIPLVNYRLDISSGGSYYNSSMVVWNRKLILQYWGSKVMIRKDGKEIVMKESIESCITTWKDKLICVNRNHVKVWNWNEGEISEGGNFGLDPRNNATSVTIFSDQIATGQMNGSILLNSRRGEVLAEGNRYGNTISSLVEYGKYLLSGAGASICMWSRSMDLVWQREGNRVSIWNGKVVVSDHRGGLLLVLDIVRWNRGIHSTFSTRERYVIRTLVMCNRRMAIFDRDIPFEVVYWLADSWNFLSVTREDIAVSNAKKGKS